MASEQTALTTKLQGQSLNTVTIMRESTLLDKLQQNVAESYDVHKRTQWTVYCGVGLSVHVSVWFVA